MTTTVLPQDQPYIHMIWDAVCTWDQLQGYSIEQECGTGCIALVKGAMRIYATPFWEGEQGAEGIYIEVHVISDGDMIPIEEESMILKQKLEHNMWTDLMNYKSIMEDYLLS